jgi:transcriptional regulator with XRE-family HTH domain
VNQPRRHHPDGRPELVRARIRHGFAQEQAAELIGVATTTWSRWERGEQRVRPVYRARLAKAWQAEPAEVERWLEAMPPARDVPDEERIDDVVAADRGDAMDRLWRWEMDASRRHLLATLSFVPGLLGEWLLAWRYDATPGSALGKAGTTGGARVGWSDVQRVHEAHWAFVQMDHQFGAGLVRPAVTDFMNTTLAPLMRSRSTSRAVPAPRS